MPALGRFLELSVPAPDIRASLDFYLRLGFTELPVNDIRAHHYAVVTDGHAVIGLHGGGLEQPCLAFVRPGVAAHARRLADLGVEIAFARLAEDEFHEAGLHAPDGTLVVVMEARTYSTGSLADIPVPGFGRARELGLPTLDPDADLPFWLEAGFGPRDEAADDDGAGGSRGEGLLLEGPGLTLGLRPSQAWAGPVLWYGAPDPAFLAARDLAPARHPGGFSLRAPEGTRLAWATATR